jgi:chromosome partitioning protein
LDIPPLTRYRKFGISCLGRFMPVVVFASPKGGAGKTTAAVILASEIASKGASVAVIDGDPRRRVTRWAGKGRVPDHLTVVPTVSEETIIDEIEQHAQSAPFVIVDLEGTASLMVAYAISRADLVIIPSQGSQMDAEDAVDAIRLVRKQERAFGRKIPYAVLLTKTSPAIRPRTLRHILAELDKAEIPRLKTELTERDAFKAIFSFGGTLEDLDRSQVSGVKDAIVNARAFVAEVIERLRAGQGISDGAMAAA